MGKGSMIPRFVRREVFDTVMWIAELDESLDVIRLISLKTHFVGLAAIGADSAKTVATFGL